MLRKEGSYLFGAYTAVTSRVRFSHSRVCNHLTTHHEQTTHICNSNTEVRQDDHCPSGLCCIHDHMTRAATVKKRRKGSLHLVKLCFFHRCLAKKHIRINYIRSPLKPANPLVCHKLPCKSSFILRSLCPH